MGEKHDVFLNRNTHWKSNLIENSAYILIISLLIGCTENQYDTSACNIYELLSIINKKIYI